jgi:phosphohistidine phosphatase
MKTLLLMRHGKSLHNDYVHSDLQRHLNAKGYAEVKAAAAWCNEHGYNPDLFVSSPAIRAYSTAVITAQFMAYPPGMILLKDSIYEASARTLLYLVQSLPPEATMVALFGHNPGFTDLIKTLAPGSIDHLVTAGVAVISLNIEHWKDASPGLGQLINKYLDA